MTRPSAAREHHATLKLLEQIASTAATVEGVPAGVAAPLPASSDVVWLELDEDDDEVVLATVGNDDGEDYVTVPLWTSFAVPHPQDSDAVLAPLLDDGS